MRLDEFDFELPQDRIAQRPPDRRGDSRLMVQDRSGARIHDRFANLQDYLQPGDLLVLNDTRVLPARLYGEKETGGKLDLLLVEPLADRPSVWSCLMRSSRTPPEGTSIRFSASFRARYIGRVGDRFLIDFEGTAPEEFRRKLEAVGRMPLPPYIQRDPIGDPLDAVDRDRYQTVFAASDGAIAAPTAGLHFDRDHLQRLEAFGIRQTAVTLHVGPGTFLPVRAERVDDHSMHAERFEISNAAADAIRETRNRGGRVIAVGTTVTRTLEACARTDRLVTPASGTSDLFIRPGYEFKVVDGLITNFHLPKSTLLMLVSAFAGLDPIRQAYREALENGYRFYSYGDAMLLR